VQKLAEVCIKRPVFATMIVMALSSSAPPRISGWASIAFRPWTCPPSPCASSSRRLHEEIETQLTQKLEEQINTIQGIQELRSISTPGNSLVIVTFVLSRNIDVAAQTCATRSRSRSATCRAT